MKKTQRSKKQRTNRCVYRWSGGRVFRQMIDRLHSADIEKHTKGLTHRLTNKRTDRRTDDQKRQTERRT